MGHKQSYHDGEHIRLSEELQSGLSMRLLSEHYCSSSPTHPAFALCAKHNKSTHRPPPTPQPLDQWDTSSVTDISSMFRDSAINQDINRWDVSKVPRNPPTTFAYLWLHPTARLSDSCSSANARQLPGAFRVRLPHR